jgi:hypothetical protein
VDYYLNKIKRSSKMRKYKHWLKIDGIRSELKQYEEIEKYLKNYPNAKVTIYLYEYNLFDKVVLLECEQNYDDLDMMVNSLSHPLRRLINKPKNIFNPKQFEIPEYLLKSI